ncbi:132_t:CDS:1, partial [Funneliformis geosporum]
DQKFANEFIRKYEAGTGSFLLSNLLNTHIKRKLSKEIRANNSNIANDYLVGNVELLKL